MLRLRRPCGLPAFRIEAGGRRGQKTFRERLRKLSVILQLHIDFSSSQKGKRRIPFLQMRAGVRLLIAVAAFAAAALLFGGVSSAVGGAPFWTEGQAQEHVILGPVEMNGRLVRLADALCVGTGRLHIRVRVGRKWVKKYQRFNCLLTPARERRFWVQIRTVRGGNWQYVFLQWA